MAVVGALEVDEFVGGFCDGSADSGERLGGCGD
jgi:hypothetical protein